MRRRRTQVVGLVVIVLPVIIALAFKVGGTGFSSNNANANSSALVTLATTGGANFAMFTEFASVGFLLVVIVALFCGDAVASEASWSSLRYLLALPVPRSRLLRQKLIVAVGFSVAVNVLLPVWAYLVGGAFFGWAPAHSPISGEFTNGQTLVRLGIVIVYATGQALTVAAIAFLLSVVTDAPLGAVGGATFLIVISNILDSITVTRPVPQVPADALPVPVVGRARTHCAVVGHDPRYRGEPGLHQRLPAAGLAALPAQRHHVLARAPAPASPKPRALLAHRWLEHPPKPRLDQQSATGAGDGPSQPKTRALLAHRWLEHPAKPRLDQQSARTLRAAEASVGPAGSAPDGRVDDHAAVDDVAGVHDRPDRVRVHVPELVPFGEEHDQVRAGDRVHQ